MSVNRVVLIGRMVRDPELRTTNTGKNVVEFVVAVDKRIKPTDPNASTADFFRCKAWNQTADFVANYGGKGRLTAVDGRLETRKYVDKDGNNREIVEIVADNVNLLDRDNGERNEATPSTPQTGYRPNPTPRPAAPAADEYDPFASDE